MLPGVSEEEIWAQLYALAEKCHPHVVKSTICIYGWQDKLKATGSGVLLRVADRHFLISAAHVLDLTFYHQFQLYTSVSFSPAPPVPLLFVRRASSAKPVGMAATASDLRDADPLDFSVAELQPETAEQISGRFKFLQLGDLEVGRPCAGAGLYVCGYPIALTQESGFQMDTFPLGYVSTPLQTEPEVRDRDKELLLYYCRDCVRWNGDAAHAPEPYGLSGCGIWQLSKPPQLPVDTSPASARLVGIQHRWRSKSHYLVGTSVSWIAPLLWRDYPDLRAALQLLREVTNPMTLE